MQESNERQPEHHFYESQLLQIVDALEQIAKSLDRLATFLEAMRTREETKDDSHGS